MPHAWSGMGASPHRCQCSGGAMGKAAKQLATECMMHERAGASHRGRPHHGRDPRISGMREAPRCCCRLGPSSRRRPSATPRETSDARGCRQNCAASQNCDALRWLIASAGFKRPQAAGCYRVAAGALSKFQWTGWYCRCSTTSVSGAIFYAADRLFGADRYERR